MTPKLVMTMATKTKTTDRLIMTKTGNEFKMDKENTTARTEVKTKVMDRRNTVKNNENRNYKFNY